MTTLLVRFRFVWAGISVLTFWLLSRYTEGFTQGPVLCPFKLLTGMDCPTCGTTRGVAALLNGDISSAWSYNPLSFVVALLFVTALLSPNTLRSMYQRLAYSPSYS